MRRLIGQNPMRTMMANAAHIRDSITEGVQTPEFGIQRRASFSEKLKRPSEILDSAATLNAGFRLSFSVKPKAFGEISLEIASRIFVALGLLYLPPSAS